ncbi:MAG: hypothetical protein LBU37_04705 [Tannerellaceae bacterium]|nr:hypothetical protein [Tannerellaceae bacterium]
MSQKLFSVLGRVVGCEVKVCYRMFWNVRTRTGEERTVFLNKLKKSLSDK